MKTFYIEHFKRLLSINIFVLIFCSTASFSQENEIFPDSTKTGFTKGKLDLANPPSILEAYTYDPVTNRYIYTNSVDGFNINYPIILTPKEYEELMMRESMRSYFKKKSDAIDGKKEGTEEEKKNLLPRYYINNSFFETVFGSNTIDVKPTGSVEVDLGVRYSKQDNPAFSPQNRSTFTFDFDQRISMGLTGKVGTRLSVNANYDTESTFAFQNLIKLEYAPTEDDIIQKIEVGNVSMPLNSSLIRGAQSLFGVKAQLQFGKTTVTGVFSEQKSQTKTVTAQGGGTVQDFELFGLDYDADRHFFLSQYFRNQYDNALRKYPFIDSRVQITRMEVWVTNRQNRVATTNNNVRNIVALQDLGEAQITGIPDTEIIGTNLVAVAPFFESAIDAPVDNKNNRFNPNYLSQNPPPGTGLLNTNIREISSIAQGFNGFTTQPSEGKDYAKLENARKLNANEYTFHPQLGYISLQQRLANDEVIGVAYQYTIGNEVYQVGEFGNDGVAATQTGPTNPVTNQPDIVSSQTLIVKMLKSSLTSITSPIWNLMMKNIYQIPGAYQLEKEDFKFNILYSDPSPLNYITPVLGEPFPANPAIENRLSETTLLKVFNVDKLNFNNDPQAGGDGFFDFIQGLTVDTQNGRLIFTTKEPFGELLFKKLTTDATAQQYNNPLSYNLNQKKYVFQNLYRKSQAAALQESQKNKFQLRGKFKSSGGEGIPIGAFNVPKGSVVVTAGGRVLQEGIDYSVNYQAGRVQILDPSLQASNTPIQVSVENNSVFGQQTRRFMGVNVEHKFSENFVLGATYLNLSERPLTQKSNYGQESVNNSIFGMNTNFSTEVPFFTRLANKLPNMDTDAPSNLSVRGEVAFLKPGTPTQDQFDGEATIYVDDFEGSQSTIDLRSPQAWSLSSTPIKEGSASSYQDFNGSLSNDLQYGFKRSKLNWYSVDPIFYSQRPAGVTIDDVSSNRTRRIYSRELYPNTDIAAGQLTVINTLDLTYYPKERGPYNNNPVAANVAPKDNFGGITRALNSTNFEQSNVEYIQFWVMDPYEGIGKIPDTNTGKIYFNLGAISEDILRDGKKQFENGLPASGLNSQLTATSVWGKVPQAQSLLYAFDTDTANRSLQDVGFDGLSDAEEAAKYSNFAGTADPAGDNFQFYLSAEGNILNRYKNYNGLQGNSPVDVTDNNRGNSITPDVEDLNRDNTMDEINAYYEYGIEMKKGLKIGDPFVTDIIDKNIPASDVPNGVETKVRWIQFKIPVSKPESTIGGISDFRSIRFMRMFMTGFEDEVTLRFGALDLVRGEWRRYNNSLDADITDTDPDNDGTDFDIEAVNIEENAPRYISPPGVVREQLVNNNSVINQNEQSLALRVKGVNGLEGGDSRAAFKNITVDMRQFKKLKMFLHAESIDTTKPLLDNEMIGFVRIGNDFTENFYQIELPLKVTANNARTQAEVWPEENNIDLTLSQLTQLKIQSRGTVLAPNEIFYAPNNANGKLKIGVRGNPNLGLVRTLMVGVKNSKERTADPTINAIKGEVWFNELRLSDQDNNGGMAAVLSIDTNIADFATLSASGKLSTIGFGTIEQGPNERSREDIKQYNIVSNFSLGKLLPKKWGINLPFNYAIGEETITPQYDPFSQDILLKQLIDVTQDQAEKDNILNRAIDYTKRQSINFIGVKKERGEKQKPRIYDPENLTLSYSYNKEERHNFEIEKYTDQQVTTTADYAYNFQPKAIEPFKKSKFFKKSSYWKLLSDFNFNYLPSSINFSSSINRQYNKQQFRQVEVIGLPLDALYRRNFLFNYNYGFNYNLTKSLKVNFTATSSNIVRNYLNANNEPNNDITIWDDYWNSGDPNQHNQQLTVNYELPFNKIPFLSFLKSSYTYTGDSSWQKSSDALANIEIDNLNYNLGNTIQNAGSHKLNATLSMESFYKYAGLTKGPKKVKAPKPEAPKPGQKIENKGVVQPDSNSIFKDGLIGLLTSVKNIQGNYTENRGTVLPGYIPGIGFFGTSKPTLGFVFGSQDEVRFEAAKRGYLTNYQNFNQNFTQIASKTLNFTANMDLFPDFKIDLTADRTYATNYSEQYDVSPNGDYNSRSPFNTGNFAISTTMLKTAFKTSDENQSSPFEDLKNNRIIIANRLALQNGIDISNPINLDADGFPKGFGKNSQAVLIPSFLAAYTGLISSKQGEDAKGITFDTFRNIPIPNMTIKYSGLMRYKSFKDKFKRFSLQSAYKASYTINTFRSNLDYDKNPGGLDSGGNFLNKTLIQNINLVEQFSPLLRIDMELKSSVKILAEMKKDRALSMSFDNNLLTEVKGIEYIVGLGYRIKDVTFSTKLADNPTGIIKSDINIKADVSYRNSQTIVRNLDYNNNQLSGGQNIWSAKFTADYSLSKNFTAIFFYDHSFSKAVISTSFPVTNIRSGLTLRYNFGN